MEYQFTAQNFQSEVLDSSIPVLVDFYADWCGPCKSMARTIKKIADEYDGRIKVGKVNTDVEPELTQAFRVVTIPSFFMIKDGEIVGHVVGTIAKSDLKKQLDATLA